jgi:hypothetical protein
MSGDPGHRKTGWWEELDSSSDPSESLDLDEEDLDRSVEDHVEERTEDRWKVSAITIADRGDDGKLYLLVVRHGVGGEGQLLLDERYFTFDPSDPWGEHTGYTSNGITRRVNGEGLLLGLKIAYASLADTGLGGKRQLLEASNGQLLHNTEKLTEKLGEILGIEPEPEVEEETDSDSEEISSEPIEEPDRKGWVRCTKCGESLREDQATQLSSGPPLGDVYAHPKGECPDQGGETDE